MPRSTHLATGFFCTVAAIAISSAAALAQTETETETEAQEPTTTEGLSMGEVVINERQPGDTYVSETFGDWSMRCVVAAEGDDPCQMYQLLNNPDGDPVAEFTMIRLPDGGEVAAGATIIVPLETNLQTQLSIKVDDGPTKRYPFLFCNSVGCYARIGLTAEEIESYKSGANAEMWIFPVAAPDTRVSVSVSLTGFTAAFDNVTVASQ